MYCNFRAFGRNRVNVADYSLRLALTGKDSGPEMAGIVARMGKGRAVQRLTAAAKR